MDVIRLRLIVSGRVQGVAYRAACQSMARTLGLTGWVRNRHDGTVEVAAEGESDAVTRLVEWCRVGPPHARVTDVATSDEQPIGDHDFRITTSPP